MLLHICQIAYLNKNFHCLIDYEAIYYYVYLNLEVSLIDKNFPQINDNLKKKKLYFLHIEHVNNSI